MMDQTAPCWVILSGAPAGAVPRVWQAVPKWKLFSRRALARYLPYGL